MVVVGYVIKGRWSYLEHDWIAEEGSFVYEPPGEVHTLTVPDDCPEMITFFNISGAMIYLDEAGRQIGYEDVWTKIEMCRAHYAAYGLGAGYRRAVHPLTSMPLHVACCAVRAPHAARGCAGRCRVALNPRAPAFPLGTLAANLIGGYLVGLAVAWFGARTELDRRLAAVRDHRFPRRPHDVLDVFRRSRSSAAARRVVARRRACARTHLAGLARADRGSASLTLSRARA